MRWNGILKALGPGLLLAATATGVSHLVQSTRAGATYGLVIAWAIILANVMKYPFFLFGPRYAAATQESLVDGYRRLGQSRLIIFIILTISTMFVIQATVTLVTAGVASLFIPIGSPLILGFFILVLCAGILARGQYAWLDPLIKVVILLLVLSTCTAAVLAWVKGGLAKPDFEGPALLSTAGFGFLIALMGWMPAPIDVSVWNSLWTLARQRQTQHRPTLKEESIDFHIGYIGTSILALVFMSLGAFVMYGSGETFANSASGFAQQFSDLYARGLGEWTRPLIIVAAFTTMFSTTLAALDAYARVLRRIYVLSIGDEEGHDQKSYLTAMVILVVGTTLVLSASHEKMLSLVDLATVLSFLSAPVLAWMNLELIQSPHVPVEAQPSPLEKRWAQLGLYFLSAFALLYVLLRVST